MKLLCVFFISGILVHMARFSHLQCRSHTSVSNVLDGYYLFVLPSYPGNPQREFYTCHIQYLMANQPHSSLQSLVKKNLSSVSAGGLIPSFSRWLQSEFYVCRITIRTILNRPIKFSENLSSHFNVLTESLFHFYFDYKIGFTLH